MNIRLNNYNHGTPEQQIERLQELMGLTEVKEAKEIPYGTIEKVVKAGDGKTYGIVKENKRFYLKKAENDKDLTLESFEYLGGSERYKSLHEYNSYNMADKMLELEVANINRDLNTHKVLLKEEKEFENNLQKTPMGQAVRDDIERFQAIMKNAEKGGRKTLNEISLEDDQDMLTDDVDDDEAISLDDELTNAEDEIQLDSDELDGDELDVDELDDEELDKEDVELDRQLIDRLDTAIEKLDKLIPRLDLNDIMDDKIDDDEDEIDIDDIDDIDDITDTTDESGTFPNPNEDEVDIEDEFVAEGIETTASRVTEKKPYDYTCKNVKDNRGRNNIPNTNADGKASIDAYGTDTLNKVSSTLKEAILQRLSECGFMNNLATKATADEFEDVECGGGRNNLPDISTDGELDYTNIHKDTLDNVCSVQNQKGNSTKIKIEIEDDYEDDYDDIELEDVTEQQNYEWDIDKGKNISEKDNATPTISKIPENATRFVVDGKGNVYGYVNECGNIVGLATKKPKKSNPNKPFDKKVKLITDMLFKECIEAGIIEKA